MRTANANKKIAEERRTVCWRSRFARLWVLPIDLFGFSLRLLSGLCVSAVKLSLGKSSHRRDAENAEYAQSFSRPKSKDQSNVSCGFRVHADKPIDNLLWW